MELTISSQSAILHLLRHRPAKIKRLLVAANTEMNARLTELISLAKEKKISVDYQTKKTAGVEPLTAQLHPFVYTDLKEFLKANEGTTHGLVLALDHLQDPQNLGALCRSAEALGILAVVLPKDRSAVVSPGVYHASVGAVETLPVIQVSNLAESLKRFKDQGFWILGTALEGDVHPLSETPKFEKAVLVMGAELEGLSNLVQKNCDWLVRIPLTGKVQSLNVSAAGAILMHELTK